MAEEDDDADMSTIEEVVEAGDEDMLPATPVLAYEPASEEELLYEKQDAAARPIQAMVRRYLGAKYAREYGKQVFVKEFDEEKKKYCYVDTRRSPPTKQWTKPRWLGKKDDLVAEKRYKAPPGYPARRQTQRQFALVCHTAVFDDPKVPNLASVHGVKLEHEELKERMQNPFTANFSTNDSAFLWEPSRTLFLKTLEALRVKCQAHVDAEARSLKDRLEDNFRRALDRLYNTPQASMAGMPAGGEAGGEGGGEGGSGPSAGSELSRLPPLPPWDEASSFTSPLLDEPSWQAFDRFRLAMQHARESAALAVAAAKKAAKEEAAAQALATGQKVKAPTPEKKKTGLAARSGPLLGGAEEAVDPDAPTPSDRREAMAERQKLFEEWRLQRAEDRKVGQVAAQLQGGVEGHRVHPKRNP